MKQQNLNKVIKEGLAKGEGLPYKDEYWHKMDDLLNESMPNNTVQPTVTKVAKVSKGLKLIAALSIATSIAVITYYSLFSNSGTNSSAQSKIQQSNNQTSLEDEHLTNDNHSTPNSNSPNIKEREKQTTDITHSDNASLNIASSPVAKSAEADQAKSLSIKMIVAKNTKSRYSETRQNDQPPLFMDNASIINTHTAIENPSVMTQGLYSTTEENEEALVTKTTDFNLIQPTQNAVIEIKHNDKQYDQSSLLKYPNRNRIIQHASVSPFVGINNTYREQTYTSNNIMYTNPKQTHIVAGLNVQLESKLFMLRTGLGVSTTQLNSSYQSTENKYTRDTNYIILNPTYQTTPSGKPIALIRQQIDSTLTSSQTSLHEGSTAYQYLIIPLTIQYRIAHNRYSFLLEGGTINNFIISTQSNSSLPKESSEKQALPPKYLLQFTGGTGMGYALNSKYTIEVRYNYALSGKSSSSNWLNNSHLFTIMITRNLW